MTQTTALQIAKANLDAAIAAYSATVNDAEPIDLLAESVTLRTREEQDVIDAARAAYAAANDAYQDALYDTGQGTW